MKEASIRLGENLLSVGIVIPTYNSSLFLDRALSSLIGISQCSVPYVSHVVVVDDGSENPSENRKVIEKYVELLNITYLFQTNLGPSAARNLGISYLDTEWVAFLDSDDELLLHGFIKRLDNLKELLALKYEVNAIYGGYVVDHLNGSLSKFSKTTVDDFDICQLGKANGVPGGCPAYIFRRKALLMVGSFDTSLKYNEDFDLIARLSIRFGGICGDNTPCFIRHMNPNSLTRKNKTESLRGNRKFLYKALRYNYFTKTEITKRIISNFVSLVKSKINLKR